MQNGRPSRNAKAFKSFGDSKIHDMKNQNSKNGLNLEGTRNDEFVMHAFENKDKLKTQKVVKSKYDPQNVQYNLYQQYT